MPINPQEKINEEFQRAETARMNRNEGQARVCARRAAGIAIGEYLSRHGYPLPGPSAIDRLKYIQQLPSISPEIKTVTKHLTTRVTENFTLPIDVDLVAEAKWLVNQLLNDIQVD